MNRAVKYYVSKSSCRSFGYFVVRAYEYAPEAYEKNKAFHNQHDRLANPVELAKYGIKIYSWLPKGDGKVSLLKMQQIDDPLGIIDFWKFTGKFSYSKDEQAFVPCGKTIKSTRKMKVIWNKVEPRRVQKAWNDAKQILRNPDGQEPVLSYEYE